MATGKRLLFRLSALNSFSRRITSSASLCTSRVRFRSQRLELSQPEYRDWSVLEPTGPRSGKNRLRSGSARASPLVFGSSGC